jgi:hypothetical protein
MDCNCGNTDKEKTFITICIDCLEKLCKTSTIGHNLVYRASKLLSEEINTREKAVELSKLLIEIDKYLPKHFPVNWAYRFDEKYRR